MEMMKLTDKQKELLKNCKYYKGEMECPSILKDIDFLCYYFWEAECWYVLEKNNDEMLEVPFVTHYDGIPRLLVKCLFAMYDHIETHWCDCLPSQDGFERFMEQYIQTQP